MIGPTFGRELQAAGLGGLPFSVNGDGTCIGLDALTPQQREALAAVIEAHDPSAALPWPVPKITIIRRLRAAGKFDTALTALKADPFLYELWSAALEIQSDDVNARALFTAVGADPDAILAPEVRR